MTDETTNPIRDAIQSAIAKWEREPFYFNQAIVQTPLAGPSGAHLLGVDPRLQRQYLL